jgi:hypothetical protein
MGFLLADAKASYQALPRKDSENTPYSGVSFSLELLEIDFSV